MLGKNLLDYDRTNKNTRRTKAHIDWVLIFFVYAMAVFGVFAVAAATFNIYSDPSADVFNQIVTSTYGLRQAIFVLISPIILGFLIAIPYEFIYVNVKLVYWGSLFLLALAFAGEKIAGISAFISLIWGFTLQPAEFAKIALIAFMAKKLESVEDPFYSFKSAFTFLVIIISPIFITLAQGEMGSAMVMMGVAVAIIFAAGMNWKRVLALGGIGIVSALLLVMFWRFVNPESYRLERILALFMPELVSDAAKYQVNNSIMAIGAGGQNGVGAFVQGSITQLDYVPKDWTDFIFSAIGECYGFVGTAAVITLYAIIIFRLYYLATYSQNRFGELIIIGIATMFLIHVFINIGMTIGIMPVAGIPLPFLSYGGSNMFTNMIGIGLVLNVTKNRRLTRVKFTSV